MVMKICKVCGKEFDARGNTLTCSSECGKISRKEYRKEYYENHHDEILKKRKEYYDNHGDEERERAKEYRKEYYQNNYDKCREYDKEYTQNKIAELNEKYDGDIDLILKDCPNSWQVREAIMQVEYGVSYAEAMYQKAKLNPVCEVTGESGDLVNHHLDSFNTHPEKGADLDNIVRIKSEIHDDFHNIYGRGNNTREQWFEFLEKKHNIYI